MTVEELMNKLENYDPKATVYIGIDSKKYDANSVQPISVSGLIIRKGVVIANR